MPGIGFGDPAADHRTDRGRQHRHDAGQRRGNRMQADRKQQEDGGENCRDQRAPGKTLQHTEADKRCKAAAERAADRGEGKKGDGGDKQPSQRQDARQPSGQWNRDDFGDQIRRLDPAHRIPRYRERVLDRGQRRRNHLDVEDRHEHAEAHQDEAEPRGGVGLGLDRRSVHGVPGNRVSQDAASARFSARMRMARTAALRIVKKAASSGRLRTSGSTAISPATTA